MTAVDTDVVREIPLKRLKASRENVRRTDPEAEIEVLAASIDTHGLLQTPVVKPEIDGAENETSFVLVTAGERRRKALFLLARRKRPTKSGPSPSLTGGGRPATPPPERRRIR